MDKVILSAVADVLKDERKTLQDQIEGVKSTLEAWVTERAADLGERLDQAIDRADEADVNAKARLEHVRTGLSKQVNSINDTLFDLAQRIEKLAGAEDRVTDGLRTEIKLVAELATQELDESYQTVQEDLERIQKEWAAAREADVTAIAEVVRKQVKDGEQGPPGEKGEPGQDADPADVAEVIKADETFVAGLRGQDGVGFNLKNWDGEVFRKGALVQHYIGRVYQAIKDTKDEPGESADWQRVGKGGFRWRSVRKDGVEYEDGDLYIDDGTTFLWLNGKGHMLAKRGRDGKPGQDGADGISGIDGRDAAQIVDITLDMECLRVKMDDGTEHRADLDGANAFVAETVATCLKEVSWFERLRAEAEEQKSTPVNLYRGIWQESESYRPGDLVTYMAKLYLCTKSTTGAAGVVGVSSEYWTVLAGKGGGGGGGGAGAGLPNAAATLNLVPKKLQLPAGTTVGLGAQWTDARLDLKVVGTLGDLNDRNKLPISDLAEGSLVFVKDDNRIYEWLPTNNAVRTDTLTDWRIIEAAGPKVYNRVSDLPQPGGTVHVHNGDLAIVRFHQDGRTPLNAVFMARKYGTATLPKPQPGDLLKDDGTILNVTGLTAAPLTNYVMYIEVDPTIDLTGGWPITIAANATAFVQYSNGLVDQIDIIGGTYPDWPTFAANGLNVSLNSPNPIGFLALDLASDGHTYLSVETPRTAANFIYRGVQPVPAATNPAPPTFPSRFIWMPTARDTHAKALQADPDFTDSYHHDLQITTENGHKAVKMWDADTQTWITVYDDNIVQQWIAAGNLFTGTVQEAGHGTVGAIDLANMPAETALGPTDKGHYWVFVGTPGHAIGATEIGGAASAIAGQALNVGDWIQVSEPTAGNFSYSVIPGDLLSKATAQSLFGLNNWVQGAYAVGTLIVHNGDVYKANAAILATDPAPDDAANTKWVKVPISGGIRTVATDAALPANAQPNALYMVVTSAQANNGPAFFMWDQAGGQWRQVGGAESHAMDLTGGFQIVHIGVPIGAILPYAGNTVPDGFLFCDGSTFDGVRYPVLNNLLGGNRTPDLRNQFLRGASGNLDNFTKHRHTTARPRTAFTTDNPGNHKHRINVHPFSGGGSQTWEGGVKGGQTNYTYDDAGAHTHRITGGGDSETAPDHVYVKYIIKADDNTMGLTT